MGLRFISLPLVLGYAPTAGGVRSSDLAAAAVDACPTTCRFPGGKEGRGRCD